MSSSSTSPVADSVRILVANPRRTRVDAEGRPINQPQQAARAAERPQA